MMNRYALIFAALIVALTSATIYTYRSVTAGSASTPATPTAESTPMGSPTAPAAAASTATPTATVVAAATATPPAEMPDAPVTQPTRCAAKIILAAGAALHVIGPGSEEKDIPSPGEYVKDGCSGEVYFRDPSTHAELPSQQVGDGPAPSSSSRSVTP